MKDILFGILSLSYKHGLDMIMVCTGDTVPITNSKSAELADTLSIPLAETKYL